MPNPTKKGKAILPKSKYIYQYHSSITGKMVTASYAEKNPDTTVAIKVKRDTLKEDIKRILKHGYAHYYAIRKIKQLIYGY